MPRQGDSFRARQGVQECELTDFCATRAADPGSLVSDGWQEGSAWADDVLAIVGAEVGV